MRKKNNYDKESLLARSVRGMTKFNKLNWSDLSKNVKMMVHNGRPAVMQFNNLLIQYNNRDEVGRFCLHFIVSNAWTGNQKTIYNKDYMTKDGDLRYRALASAIRRT